MMPLLYKIHLTTRSCDSQENLTFRKKCLWQCCVLLLEYSVEDESKRERINIRQKREKRGLMGK